MACVSAATTAGRGKDEWQMACVNAVSHGFSGREVGSFDTITEKSPIL